MTDKKYFKRLYWLWWYATGFAFIIILLIPIACDDNVFIGGYNKDMEVIHRQMFEVDSLLRTINMEWDSTAINFERFYIEGQRINNEHE